MNDTQAHPTALELLVFEVAGVRHALQLASVREVVAAVFITPLPEAPPAIEGLADVRGEIAAVYDLRLRWGLPPRALHPDEKLVVVWTGEHLAAFRCDAVAGAVEVDPHAVDAAEAARHGSATVTGAARLPDGLVVIHDLAGFLGAAEKLALDQALAAHAERAAE